MRRRNNTVERVAPEKAARRAEAKRALEGWVRSTGRKMLPVDAPAVGMLWEIRTSYNHWWVELEQSDLDALSSLARELGSGEKTHDERRLLATAVEMLRVDGHRLTVSDLEAKLRTRYSALSASDLNYLRALATEYRQPVGAA